MEKKYTPGPWEIESDRINHTVYEHGEYFRVLAKNPTLFSIGEISGPSNYHSQEEMRANARLISAAPELLEALQRIVSIVRDGDIENTDIPVASISYADDVITQSIGAIRKAIPDWHF